MLRHEFPVAVDHRDVADAAQIGQIKKLALKIARDAGLEVRDHLGVAIAWRGS
jgi:hypothetical protein